MVVKEDPMDIATSPLPASTDYDKIIRLDNVKNDYFESNDKITFSLYVKEAEQVEVDFEETSCLIRFKTRNAQFQQLHKSQVATAQNPLFEWRVDLYSRIHPSKCSHKITQTKIDIYLYKVNASEKWPAVVRVKPTLVLSDQSAKTTNSSKKRSETSKSPPPPSTRPLIRSENSSPNKPNTSLRPSANLYYGHTGLTNLGNTCYMNAALQLLVNATDFRDYFLENPDVFKKEINTNNALGLNGKSAICFGILMRQLWAGNVQYLAPSKLREMIASKYTHFRGFEQQDTQEFLCSLLSLLHEDLNRVAKKPFYESALECENDSDSHTTQVAGESWQRFVSRENSVVVDNFYGQFKSKLTCPECHKVSITFEPFSNLLVPIAQPKQEFKFLLVFSPSQNKSPLLTSLYFDETSIVKDLLGKVRSELVKSKRPLKAFIVNKCLNNAPDDYQLNGYCFNPDWSILSDEQKIPRLRNSQFLIINEIDDDDEETEEESNLLEVRVQQICKYPIVKSATAKCSYCSKENDNLKRCTKCFRSAYCDSECQKADWTKHSLNVCSQANDRVGFPFIVHFRQSELESAGENVESLIRSRLLKSTSQLTKAAVVDETKKNLFDMELVEFSRNGLNEDRVKYVKINAKGAQLIEAFQDELSNRNDQESNVVSLRVQIKWNIQSVITDVDKIEELDNTENVSPYVDLHDCLRLFTYPERLTSDNPWYCGKCKKHQEAKKQMSLWRLPKYLIVSLKRFQATKADMPSFGNMNDDHVKQMMMNSRFSYLLQNRVVYNKLNTMVKFPIRNLDMTKYLVNPSQDESMKTKSIYDLCAVINHHGQSISVGHYTAFARTHDRENTSKDELGWRYFDDQRVIPVDIENHVLTRDAYVLMYRLRSSYEDNEQHEQQDQASEDSETQNEEYYDIESDESAQLDDDDDEPMMESIHQTVELKATMDEEFTNLDETD